MHWIDLLTLSREDELVQRIEALDDAALASLQQTLTQALGLKPRQITLQLVRILLERVRPLALPQRVWRRSATDSTLMSPHVAEHLSKLGLDPTAERVRSLVRIASDFAEDRKRVTLDERLLATTGFRCAVCGYPFNNEDLEDYGIVSPFGERVVTPDPLKPSTAQPAKRRPTVDHVWPVSLFGSNAYRNLRPLCGCCNAGKQNFITGAHTRANVGHPNRDGLRKNSMTDEVFYSVLARDRSCTSCGAAPTERELTVRPRRDAAPLVADNLQAICYECAAHHAAK